MHKLLNTFHTKYDLFNQMTSMKLYLVLTSILMGKLMIFLFLTSKMLDSLLTMYGEIFY